jgi:molybdopterin-containing oxidoreductase family iron-sulfur binding subunit
MTMDDSRRNFLKIAGACALGAGVGLPVVSAVGSSSKYEAKQKALKGKRWAMVIDTKKCQEAGNCQACMNACHSIHNVPETENKSHEIKWIWKEDYHSTFPTQAHKNASDEVKHRKMVVLCNHCDSPSCVRVCPTQATFKREDGVVMMDMHRCIGCRYCISACPYGSRSFNFFEPKLKNERIGFPKRSKGVVEKCNFCAERLAEGQIPACVEVCTKMGHGALTFGDLADPRSPVSQKLRQANTIRRKPVLGTQPHVFYIV